jgi:hypothetical protein
VRLVGLVEGGPQQADGVVRAAGHRQPPGLARRPGQQCGMVLRLEDDHLGVARQRAGEQVERVGAVAGEDDGVVLARADELAHLLASLLVPRGGHPGGPPRAAVDRGVRAQGGVDRLLDADQGRGRGSVVEVRVVHRAREGGHQQRLRHHSGQGAGLAEGRPVGHGAQVVPGLREGCGATGAGRGGGDRHGRSLGSGGPGFAGPRLPAAGADGPVVTRSTPPRRRVAGQQAGATRWHS